MGTDRRQLDIHWKLLASYPCPWTYNTASKHASNSEIWLNASRYHTHSIPSLCFPRNSAVPLHPVLPIQSSIGGNVFRHFQPGMVNHTISTPKTGPYTNPVQTQPPWALPVDYPLN